jgi:hypothetical protein
MSGRRKIIFSAACDASAACFGGYERIDRALDSVIDALTRNPYGFHTVESDWFSARYALTKPIGNVTALVWLFRIEQGDVVIEDVEEFDDY